MVTLDRQFGRQLTDALLEDVEDEIDDLVTVAVERSHERLRDWATERDYQVEPIIDSLEPPEISRWRYGVIAEWGWSHEATPYFEFGTSDHTIQGQPVLSFVWDAEDAPRWVKKEFDREGDGYRVFFRSVEVSGVAETRFIRAGLDAVRRELRT